MTKDYFHLMNDLRDEVFELNDGWFEPNVATEQIDTIQDGSGPQAVQAIDILIDEKVHQQCPTAVHLPALRREIKTHGIYRALQMAPQEVKNG